MARSRVDWYYYQIQLNLGRAIFFHDRAFYLFFIKRKGKKRPEHKYRGFTSNPRITGGIPKTQTNSKNTQEGNPASTHQPTMPAKEKKYIRAMVTNRWWVKPRWQSIHW
jgi:hypothetical protein